MARLQPFQRHAITAPVFDRTKLHRARLVEILQDNLWRKLILVIAPAGYGKTTLLADLTAHTDRPVCWVRLTEHDQDPMRLAWVLVESLGMRFPRARKHLNLSGLESLPPEGVGRAMAAAIAQAVPRSLLLIIDDLHLLSTSLGSAAFLSGLLGAAPQSLCCVLSGREMPDLPLAKPAADGNILTIGAGDLALMEDELEGVLAAEDGSRVDEATRHRLMADTKGWVAGVLLLRLRGLEALRASAPNGKELTFEYFAAEVLEKLSDELKDFVVRSSVLPVMTAEAVEQVLRVEDGGRWLRMAVAKGLFVSTSGTSPRTYEYHPLFREFLLQKLERVDPRAARELKARAAAHMARIGAIEQAVDAYWALGERRRAVSLAERASRDKLSLGQKEIVKHWVNLADELGAPVPNLRRRQIQLVILFGEIDTAQNLIKSTLRRYGLQLRRSDRLGFRAWHSRIEAFSGNPWKAIREGKRLLRQIGSESSSWAARAAHVAVAHGYWCIGLNLSSAETHARLALRAATRARSGWATYYTMELLGAIHHARGHSTQERLVDERLAADSSRWPSLEPVFRGLAVAFWAHRDRQWAEAIRQYDQVGEVASRLGLAHENSVAWVGSAEVRADMGLWAEARLILARGFASIVPSGGSASRVWALTGLARVARLSGDFRSARRAIKDAKKVQGARSRGLGIELEESALLVSQGTPTAGRRLRGIIRRIEKSDGEVPILTLSQFFLAQHLWRFGNKEKAIETALLSLRNAEETAYLHTISGELIGAPDFHRFLMDSLPRDKDLAVLWKGIDDARRLARFEAIQQPNSVNGRVIVHALGSEKILVENGEVKLKPLFSELLCYIIDRRRVLRETLMDEFWPNASLARQRSSLNTAIHSIRKSLGANLLLRDGDAITAPKGDHVVFDAEEFEHLGVEALSRRAPEETSIGFLAAALDVYKGPFLPGRRREWALERRRHLETLFLRLALAYGNCCVSLGRGEQALGTVMSALDADPYDERIRMLAASILSAGGRGVEAMHLLAKYSELLEAEHLPGPSVEMLGFERMVLSGYPLHLEPRGQTIAAKS